jgi:hypothetical protein
MYRKYVSFAPLITSYVKLILLRKSTIRHGTTRAREALYQVNAVFLWSTRLQLLAGAGQVLYSFATQRFSRGALFNIVVCVFMAWFVAFGVLYPSHEHIHFHALAENALQNLPSGLAGAVGMVRACPGIVSIATKAACLFPAVVQSMPLPFHRCSSVAAWGLSSCWDTAVFQRTFMAVHMSCLRKVHCAGPR